ATAYRVQIATDPGFATIVHEETIVGGGQLDYVGLQGNTYYARAAATDCAGNVGPLSPPSNGSTVPYHPDLVVRSVDAPPQATSGQVIQVKFTVADSAIGGTNTPQWYDYVYLSPTRKFDPATATFLGQMQDLTALAPHESYTSSAEFTLPLSLSG